MIEPALRRDDEVRVFGVNACLAAFHARPEDLRKAWIASERIAELRPIMAFCVANRRGYRVVAGDDLTRIAGSRHHQGVVLAMRRPLEARLSAFLADLSTAPTQLLWLDGVGNPHNFGAILRCAAHFGVAAALLPEASPLTLSGAALRIAEGGAEAVPLVRLGRVDGSIAMLRRAGFVLVATVVRDGVALFGQSLPPRIVWVLGAEDAGVDPALSAACASRIVIPGSGRVESLNVAAATAVLTAEWARQHRHSSAMIPA